MATLWEMQIKIMSGKWDVGGPLHVVIEDWLAALDAQILPLEVRHISTLASLERHHGDPFDRILVAQAVSDGLTILTSDATFRSYPTRVIW